MKRIYILCPVTIADESDRMNIEIYVDNLESEGHVVHYPARDTDQDGHPFDICLENGAAIQEADEIHIFYNSKSKGSHFDLGMLFALIMLKGEKKKVKVKDVNISDPQSGYGTGWVDLMAKIEKLTT